MNIPLKIPTATAILLLFALVPMFQHEGGGLSERARPAPIEDGYAISPSYPDGLASATATPAARRPTDECVGGLIAIDAEHYVRIPCVK